MGEINDSNLTDQLATAFFYGVRLQYKCQTNLTDCVNK